MPASLKRKHDADMDEALWPGELDGFPTPGAAVLDAAPSTLTDIEAQARNCVQSAAKRCLDVVVALVALLFLSPLLIMIALAIRLESGGPVLFRQRRGGRGGDVFVILKFRSMEADSGDDRVVHASRNDTRVTRFGAFLRRSSLDELPQLINVLKGEMSLVGPRPHALIHDRHYRLHIPNYDQRSLVRPGLTGLAQVSGNRGEIRRVADMAMRVERDIEYIRTWSMALDLMILARTLIKLPFDAEAY